MEVGCGSNFAPFFCHFTVVPLHSHKRTHISKIVSPLPFNLVSVVVAWEGGTVSCQQAESAEQRNRSPGAELNLPGFKSTSSVPLNGKWGLLRKNMDKILKKRKTKTGDGQRVCFPLSYNEKCHFHF